MRKLFNFCHHSGIIPQSPACAGRLNRSDELGMIAPFVIGPAVTTDAHQDAERDVFDEEVRAAVAHKGERRPRNRHEPDIHPYVDDELREEINGNSSGEERLKILRRVDRDGEYTND